MFFVVSANAKNFHKFCFFNYDATNAKKDCKNSAFLIILFFLSLYNDSISNYYTTSQLFTRFIVLSSPIKTKFSIVSRHFSILTFIISISWLLQRPRTKSIWRPLG